MIRVKSRQVVDEYDELEFSLENLDDARTTRTLRNIKKALVYSLKKDYKKIDNELADEILKIHGLHKDNFDFVNNVGRIMSEKLNDVSIDDNSNKNEKIVKGILQEVKISVDKAVGYDYLYRTIKELYGKKEAKRLTGKMFDYSLALSDSTNIMIPYCYSIDASKLITMGKTFGQLHSKPAKRLDSYISVLNEIIHQMSSHVCGAIAIGSFFLDVAHLLIYKENYSYEELKNNKEFRKYVENQFQRIIHGVNSLSRNAVESPFSNISLFDRPKLRALVDKLNYGWYFPFNKKVLEEHKFSIQEEEWSEYVVEYIIELQSIYMDFFDRGDPNQGGMPYRFPVSTINVSKTWNEKQQLHIVEDKKFLKSICKKDIYRYNVFVSEGQKVASCCRLLSNNELLELAGQSNSFGGGSSVSLGSHRVLTINFMRIALEAETFENFFEILEKRVADSAKILKAHKQLLILLTENGLQSLISNGWIQMSRLFSTFGILGAVEAETILKKRFESEIDKDGDVLEEILKFFNYLVSVYSEKEGIVGNIEQIPGESMAVRLAKVDKLLYTEKEVPWKIYSNQFIPLWDDKSSIWERMDKDGKYNQLLTGGGIVHINTGEYVTSKQAEQLIEYSIGCGCEHFAITGTFIKCEEDHVSLGNADKCPICGKDIVDKIARVVGFWTPISSWNEAKVKYDHDRRKEYVNGDFDRDKEI